MDIRCTKEFVLAVLAKSGARITQAQTLGWKDSGWLRN